MGPIKIHNGAFYAHAPTSNAYNFCLSERSLRTIYKDYKNSYSDILDLHGEKSIRQYNIQYLMIEVYKFLNGLSTDNGTNF